MNEKITVLAIGDVVGKPGRTIIREILPGYIIKHNIDLVIINGENAAGGTSITAATAMELLSFGADVITTGNHVWDNKDIETIIDKEERLIRPANFPEGVPGRGYVIVSVKDLRVCVMNLMGRLFMLPLDDPFRKFDAIYGSLKDKADVFIVDFHAEATSEKQAFGWYADGRASAVFGTHTHVQTADERILPGGTAYITDIGMTGAFNSVIGMERGKSVERFLKFTKLKYDVASGNVKLNGIEVEIDRGGRAGAIRRIILEN
jgi:metallophosphoesterase (TIGR00282 family)